MAEVAAPPAAPPVATPTPPAGGDAAAAGASSAGLVGAIGNGFATLFAADARGYVLEKQSQVAMTQQADAAARAQAQPFLNSMDGARSGGPSAVG